MKHLKFAAIIMVALMLAVSSFAQRSRLGSRDGSGPLIDPAAVVVVEGTVDEFTAGLGQGMPELVVVDAEGALHTFILGPFWYLEEQGFVADTGDLVTVTAYTCTTCDTGVAVVSVVNTTQGVTLTLRDESGIPLWTQRQPGDGSGNGQGGGDHGGNGAGGNGSGQGDGECDGTGSGNQGQGSGTNGNGGPDGVTPDNAGGNGGQGGDGSNGGNGGQGGNGSHDSGRNGAGVNDQNIPDLSQVTTYSGTVVSWSLVTGGGPATVVLATADGDVTIFLSPASILVKAGYEPAEGAALEIVAAPVTIDGAQVWLAITVTDVASGLQIVLRDPATGLPVTGARHGRR